MVKQVIAIETTMIPFIYYKLKYIFGMLETPIITLI